MSVDKNKLLDSIIIGIISYASVTIFRDNLILCLLVVATLSFIILKLKTIMRNKIKK